MQHIPVIFRELFRSLMFQSGLQCLAICPYKHGNAKTKHSKIYLHSLPTNMYLDEI